METPAILRRRQQMLTPIRTGERVDIHCHCLPGMDDGPANMVETLALCRDLEADGITAVVATPHQLGRFDGRNSAAEIRRAVFDLNRTAVAAGLSLRFWPGADVRIDERIANLVVRDEVMTLADGGRYLLLELPPDALIHPVGLARQLTSMGVSVLLTHPERCAYLSRDPEWALAWLEGAVHLQLTAASILGAFGPAAEQACWYWLQTGAASLVASDAHGGSRRLPCLSRAMAAVASRLGPTVAQRVCIENPQRVLRGDSIPVPATVEAAENETWTPSARTF